MKEKILKKIIDNPTKLMSSIIFIITVFLIAYLSSINNYIPLKFQYFHFQFVKTYKSKNKNSFLNIKINLNVRNTTTTAVLVI